MTLKDMAERCNGLEVYEQRDLTEDHWELVFYNKEIGKWVEVLSGMLGEPLKAAGIKPSREHLAITKVYGGIRSDQTLFRKEFGEAVVIGMFWPWQDEEHTTLKVIRSQKSDTGKTGFFFKLGA